MTVPLLRYLPLQLQQLDRRQRVESVRSQMQEAAVQPFNAAAVSNPPDCRHRIPIGPMSASADDPPDADMDVTPPKLKTVQCKPTANNDLLS